MQLETQLWGVLVLVSSYHCSTYRIADLFSSLVTFSSSFFRGPVFHPIDDCEHPLLYLPGTGIASQEGAITGSCQQNLAGMCNSVCVWWLIMGWTPGGAVSGWSILPFILCVFVSMHSCMCEGKGITCSNLLSSHLVYSEDHTQVVRFGS